MGSVGPRGVAAGGGLSKCFVLGGPSSLRSDLLLSYVLLSLLPSHPSPDVLAGGPSGPDGGGGWAEGRGLRRGRPDPRPAHAPRAALRGDGGPRGAGAASGRAGRGGPTAGRARVARRPTARGLESSGRRRGTGRRARRGAAAREADGGRVGSAGIHGPRTGGPLRGGGRDPGPFNWSHPPGGARVGAGARQGPSRCSVASRPCGSGPTCAEAERSERRGRGRGFDPGGSPRLPVRRDVSGTLVDGSVLPVTRVGSWTSQQLKGLWCVPEGFNNEREGRGCGARDWAFWMSGTFLPLDSREKGLKTCASPSSDRSPEGFRFRRFGRTTVLSPRLLLTVYIFPTSFFHNC